MLHIFAQNLLQINLLKYFDVSLLYTLPILNTCYIDCFCDNTTNLMTSQFFFNINSMLLIKLNAIV